MKYQLLLISAFVFSFNYSAYAKDAPTSTKSVQDAVLTDLIFIPFSGHFTAMEKLLVKIAVCDSASMIADNHDKVAFSLIQAKQKASALKAFKRHKINATIDQYELEYNRMWWQNYGYIKGLAKGFNTTESELAHMQVKDCITENTVK